MSAFSYRCNPETCLESFRKIHPEPFLSLRQNHDSQTPSDAYTHDLFVKTTSTTVTATGQMSSQNTFISSFFPILSHRCPFKERKDPELAKEPMCRSLCNGRLSSIIPRYRHTVYLFNFRYLPLIFLSLLQIPTNTKITTGLVSVSYLISLGPDLP